MKVRVFRVRIWTFFQRKRGSSVSFLARLFGRKSALKEKSLLAITGDQQLRTNLGHQEDIFDDGEFLEPGPSILTDRRAIYRRAAFSVKPEEQPLERKVHSKRNMQVITMWNPASVTTVESPVETTSNRWLKQASKRWKEHGSGRINLLDPIENGPESSQDWRQKYFDIDSESRRWPVQGW